MNAAARVQPAQTGPGFAPGLVDRLPPVRGRLTANAPIAQMTWLRVGGPAEVLFKPADRDDLAAFMAALPEDIPVTAIGVASNLLIRDGGVPGVVLRLGRDFATIQPDGDRVIAGAGALDLNVAKVAQQAAIGGLEFLVGIPGTVGGGLRMNAGAYGTEFKDVVLTADVMRRDGTIEPMTPAQMGMSYRHSDVPTDSLFLAATLQGGPGQPEHIAHRMAEIGQQREASQPIRTRTGGSTFANPDGHRAWQVIDQAGCRGLRVGGAQVSEMHCNFLINTGEATAADLESLGEEVRRRVRESQGIELRWELRRIGVALDRTDTGEATP